MLQTINANLAVAVAQCVEAMSQSPVRVVSSPPGMLNVNVKELSDAEAL